MRVLTFDIEDWFHILDHRDTRSIAAWGKYESRVQDGVERILEILAEYNRQATFFFLGWVAERHPALVRKVLAGGHEVGSHSYAHQLVYEQTEREFRADLLRSLDVIGNAAGTAIKIYRAPGFSIIPGCEWAFSILRESGIEIDSSLFPAPRAHGGYTRIVEARPVKFELESGQLIELPINVVRPLGLPVIFSGGGYFRLLPYSVIDYLVKHSEYVMSYFHPRDFDAQQPMIPNLSLDRKFRSYVGIKTAEMKLRRLLQRFQWMTVSQAAAEVRNNAPVVSLT